MGRDSNGVNPICECGGRMTMRDGLTGYWPNVPYKCDVCGAVDYLSPHRNGIVPPKLIPLATFNAERLTVYLSTLQANTPRPNGLACPYCDGELWDSSPMTLRTSYPPQLDVHCNGCGWKGTRLR